MAISEISSLSTNMFTKVLENKGVLGDTIQSNNQTENKESKTNFEEILDSAKSGVYKVNDSQLNANSKIESFIKGEDVSMHEVMLSVQEAQMSMQLMLEVRNKIYEAYQEVKGVQL